MTMMAPGPQCGRQFLEAHRAVAVLVELAEHPVGIFEIGAAGAERLFEFRFGDLAVTIAIDLRDQRFPVFPTLQVAPVLFHADGRPMV